MQSSLNLTWIKNVATVKENDSDNKYSGLESLLNFHVQEAETF